jgi:hypothetical protein
MQNNQKRNKLLFYNIIMVASMAFSLIFGLGACNPKMQETALPSTIADGTALPSTTVDGNALPFETIEQDAYAVDTGILYDYHEPGMVIISRVEELDNLDGLVSTAGFRQLQALDYSQYFALAAFQGRKGSIGYDIQVNRISRLGNTVNVYAQLNAPPPDTAVGATVTSPYHVIKVQKSGSWNQDITFNLFSGNKLVASLTHTIP